MCLGVFGKASGSEDSRRAMDKGAAGDVGRERVGGFHGEFHGVG